MNETPRDIRNEFVTGTFSIDHIGMKCPTSWEKYAIKLETYISDVRSTRCNWKLIDEGSYGVPDMVWRTECGEVYDEDFIRPDMKMKFCPACGKEIKNNIN